MSKLPRDILYLRCLVILVMGTAAYALYDIATFEELRGIAWTAASLSGVLVLLIIYQITKWLEGDND